MQGRHAVAHPASLKIAGDGGRGRRGRVVGCLWSRSSPRLEALLPLVQQADPVRRRRAQRPTSRTGTRADGPLGADVPRRLRGRAAQPGRADPVRGAQRARRRARRAHLRGLAGPRGADARARRPAVHRRRAPPGRRLRPARRQLLAPSSATPTCSPRSTSPGSRCTPPTATDDAPDRRRRRARGVQPRADRRLRRRRGRSATASRPCCDHRHRPRLEGRGPPGRPRRSCCCGWRAPATVYVPAFYDVDYLPDGRIQPGRARTAPACPWRVAQAHRDGPRRVAVPASNPLVPLAETVHERMSVEIFRGCTRGCRFCQAGMITRPVRERSITGIGEMVEHGLADDRLRGGRAARRCRAPTTPRSPTSPRASPTATRARNDGAVAAEHPRRRVQHRPGQRAVPQRPPLRPDVRARGRQRAACAR